MHRSQVKMKRGSKGFTIVELLVAITILAILTALLLPAIQQSREAARKIKCANNMKQLGLAMHSYAQSHGSLPPGYTGDLSSENYVKSWAWGALLLPHLEQRPLYDAIDPESQSLAESAANPSNLQMIQHDLSIFLCPSDTGPAQSHPYRQLLIPETLAQASADYPEWIYQTMDFEIQWVRLNPAILGDHSGMVMAHISPPIPYVNPKPKPKTFPRPDPPSDPGYSDPTSDPGYSDPPTVSSTSVNVGKSNYVGSLGSNWRLNKASWSDGEFRGNGVLGRNTRVTWSQITDGTSNTILVGERSWKNYAAVWPGVNSVNDCGFIDNQMVLGTAFYPINQGSTPINLDCDGTGSANFSSFHHGGANFLFADGSVRFLTETIDFQNSDQPNQIGLYQKLAHRNDGGITGAF